MGALHGSLQSKSRSSSQQRHSRRYSKTSSGLDTTGSSRALDSSMESNSHPSCSDETKEAHMKYQNTENKHTDDHKSHCNGEILGLKEILAEVKEGEGTA